MITDITSEADLSDLNGPVVLLFTQPSTCQPCRAFEPHYEALADRVDGVKFLRADIDTTDPVLVELFGVMGVPTLFALHGDEATPLRGRTVVALMRELTELGFI